MVVVAAAVVVVDFFIYSILRIVQYVFMFIVYVYVNVINNVLVLVRDSERNFEGVNIFTFLVYQGLPLPGLPIPGLPVYQFTW